ncbi:DUF6882 domain-containing protein [Rothia sp. P7181]|uniref:DUF6882 domain-containing protein n=1 Tax=unclassified Rothia (in: high G+C Gram-positive bacteria) TaxID=2689056 RepID=UPI003AC66C9A
MTKTLQDLIDESIFISTEYQARLAELSGGSEWSVDFSAPSFTLQSDSSVKLTPYLLGTESENRGSWIWSWQELGHFPDSVVSAAIQTRESGAQHSIGELTTDELPLTEGIARQVTLAAKALTGIYAHYPVTAGAGVKAWILLDGDALELEAPTINRMGRVMAQALQTNTAVNHQRAVDSYARLRGAHIAWDTEATAVITTTDGALRLWFDGQKISGIEAAEPVVDSAELNRCAAQAIALREQAAAERQEVERIAASEAAAQLAAREAEQKAAQEQAEREAQDQLAQTVQEHELPQTLEESSEQTVEETIEEVEGVVTTDRVYPHAEKPYDQDPQEDAQPGRITTSAIADEEIISDTEEERPVATEPVDDADTSEQEERPSAFRVAGSAPDLEEEQHEEARRPRRKEQQEKKGFFSRFFGL